VGQDNNRLNPGIKTLAVGIIIGVFIAIAGASNYHASGNPSFCTACHSMQVVGEQWERSLHKQFACIECHLPDSNIFEQVAYKTKAGLNDLYHETLRGYPAAIRISAESRDIVQGNCLRCHYSTVERTFMASQGGNCLKCHKRVVHGPEKETGGIRVE
jgi:cytochrome c nitrite reductase small subunit